MSWITDLHEAAHAVVAMALGIAPEEIVSGPDGDGHCRWNVPKSVPPLNEAIACAAGGVAVRLLADDADEFDAAFSQADCELIEDAVARSGFNFCSRRQLIDRAENIVGQYQNEILALADELSSRRRLVRDDLAHLVHRSGPFAKFSGLYAAPARRRVAAPMMRLDVRMHGGDDRRPSLLDDYRNTPPEAYRIAGLAPPPGRY